MLNLHLLRRAEVSEPPWRILIHIEPTNEILPKRYSWLHIHLCVGTLLCESCKKRCKTVQCFISLVFLRWVVVLQIPP
jgi:hypothetical protein